MDQIGKGTNMAEGPRRPRRTGSAALRPVGIIRSRLKARKNAPRQGREGAPDAWLEVHPSLGDALDGIAVGDAIMS